MATPKILSIELSHTPPIHIFYDAEWACKICGHAIAMTTEQDWNCVMCMLQKSGKDTITIFGWQLSRSGIGQIYASRIQG